MGIAIVHAAATSCALHGRCKDAVGTSCGALQGHCVHDVTGKYDIFRHISRRSHSTQTDFLNAVASLFGVTGALDHGVWVHMYCTRILI